VKGQNLRFSVTDETVLHLALMHLTTMISDPDRYEDQIAQAHGMTSGALAIVKLAAFLPDDMKQVKSINHPWGEGDVTSAQAGRLHQVLAEFVKAEPTHARTLKLLASRSIEVDSM
jgi:hypothetical protein